LLAAARVQLQVKEGLVPPSNGRGRHAGGLKPRGWWYGRANVPSERVAAVDEVRVLGICRRARQDLVPSLICFKVGTRCVPPVASEDDNPCNVEAACTCRKLVRQGLAMWRIWPREEADGLVNEFGRQRKIP